MIKNETKKERERKEAILRNSYQILVSMGLAPQTETEAERVKRLGRY